MKIQSLLLGIATTTCLLLSSSPLFACGHDMAHDEDILEEVAAEAKGKQKATILAADRDFQKGNYDETISIVMLAKPTLAKRADVYKKSIDRELIRGARLAAISTIRLKGSTSLDAKGKHVPSKSARKKNVAWATQVLTFLATKNPKEPQLQSYLAEALLLDKSSRERAKGILQKLAGQDLIVDAHGWAALASLYKKDKDNTTEYNNAVTRCRAIALTKSMCGKKKSVKKAAVKKKSSSKLAAKTLD